MEVKPYTMVDITKRQVTFARNVNGARLFFCRPTRERNATYGYTPKIACEFAAYLNERRERGMRIIGGPLHGLLR